MDLDCILSCADQAARNTFGERQKGGREGRREGGREGRREEEKKPSYKFATVIQIQTLDTQAYPSP